jgi:hypothetical protein
MLPDGSCNKLLHAALSQVFVQVLLHHPPATCVPWYTWGAAVCNNTAVEYILNALVQAWQL